MKRIRTIQLIFLCIFLILDIGLFLIIKKQKNQPASKTQEIKIIFSNQLDGLKITSSNKSDLKDYLKDADFENNFYYNPQEGKTKLSAVTSYDQLSTIEINFVNKSQPLNRVFENNNPQNKLILSANALFDEKQKKLKVIIMINENYFLKEKDIDAINRMINIRLISFLQKIADPEIEQAALDHRAVTYFEKNDPLIQFSKT